MGFMKVEKKKFEAAIKKLLATKPMKRDDLRSSRKAKARPSR
jgi:hypothetical protein